MRIRVDDKFYEFLGVPKFSSFDEIKKAYRALALKHHPDRGGEIKAMQRLNYIYEILGKHKEQYDAWLKNREMRAPAFTVIIRGYGWTYDSASTSNITGNSWTTGKGL